MICTFSGRFGDILWSLATVKAIARDLGEAVGVRIMAPYVSLCPLIGSQSYVREAEAIPAWVPTGSPHGDAPRLPPVVFGEDVAHLTYQRHPTAADGSLVEAIAAQAGVELECGPWIEAKPVSEADYTFAFNGHLTARKQEIFGRLGIEGAVDVSTMLWKQAAGVIAACEMFFGCRSANYVLAHGVGVPVSCIEPEPDRQPDLFGCPWGEEIWVC